MMISNCDAGEPSRLHWPGNLRPRGASEASSGFRFAVAISQEGASEGCVASRAARANPPTRSAFIASSADRKKARLPLRTNAVVLFYRLRAAGHRVIRVAPPGETSL